MSLRRYYQTAPQCLILGENHYRSSSRQAVVDRITTWRPHVLLHELLYVDVCLTPQEIRNRLRHCREGNLCDPRLNRDVYELGLKLNLQLVGIDPAPTGDFLAREQQMVEFIEQWLATNKRLAVVVGDTHLRDRPLPKVKQRSLLRDEFDNNPWVSIIRTAPEFQEVK